MGKPHRAIFHEFKGGSFAPDEVEGSGDVKYHLGASSDREFDGNTVHLSLTANPSHLEIVDPVVLGKVRAKQDQHGCTPDDRTHGDAAADPRRRGLRRPGRGGRMLRPVGAARATAPAARSTSSSTTRSASPPIRAISRSSPYPSDVAKMVEAPIFHVQRRRSRRPSSIAAKVATEFRQKFQKPVVIDMFCYRRFGHNEGDEPAFTQPLMYKRDPRAPDDAGDLPQEAHRRRRRHARRDVEEMQRRLPRQARRRVRGRRRATSRTRPTGSTAAGPASRPCARTSTIPAAARPACRSRRLREIGARSPRCRRASTSTAPSSASSTTARKAIETGEGIDWATAEALAFGSLLIDGHPVRLSGQDVRARHLLAAPLRC